jgi:hypothetical protein
LNPQPPSVTAPEPASGSVSLQDRLQKTADKATPRPSRRRDGDVEGATGMGVGPLLVQPPFSRSTKLSLLASTMGTEAINNPASRQEAAQPTEIDHGTDRIASLPARVAGPAEPLGPADVTVDHFASLSSMAARSTQTLALTGAHSRELTSTYDAPRAKSDHDPNTTAAISESSTESSVNSGIDAHAEPSSTQSIAAGMLGLDDSEAKALPFSLPDVPRQGMPAKTVVAQTAQQPQSRGLAVTAPAVPLPGKTTTITVPFPSFGPGHQVVAALPLAVSGQPRPMFLSGSSERTQRAVETALTVGTTPDGGHWEIQPPRDADDEGRSSDERRRHQEHDE